ncbi:MAG TPA: energy-coupling factor transporter ATPase [Thermoclostridium caenicola]|nr:energy-coupling factor transporter ATPase [Thermoclostridium caenicola]
MPGTTFERKALQEVSLDIMKGEILGIIGHTGSGKSTLVQHLNGLLKPTSGSVTVDGLECGGKSLKELRQKVGLIFQYPEHQLFEETVYKDIIFGLSRLGLPQDEIERRVKCVLDIIGLSEELLWKSPFELSGGQKRRVAIAGVLVMEPEILVLDEPTAGLDPRGSEEVFAILTELNRTQGTTILIISHSMEQIAAYCDRIAVLNRGRLEMLDTPRKVFSQEDRLRGLGLDIPEITRLFRNLHRAGYPVNGRVLTISEAVRSISETMLAKETHKGGNNA